MAGLFGWGDDARGFVRPSRAVRRATWSARRCERPGPLPRVSAVEWMGLLCGTDPHRRASPARPPIAATVAGDRERLCGELMLFEALFGRDALRVADMLWTRRPDLTLTSVRSFAALQGIRTVVGSEEEPGRIPHEVRPPVEEPAVGPGQPGVYYGSVDATPLFCTAVARLAWADAEALSQPIVSRDGRTRQLGDHLASAVRWILRRLDASPVGLLESNPAPPGGLQNQVWKDSHDSYSHADGSLARRGTVASVECQALVHDALVSVAELTERFASELPSWPLASIDPAVLRERASEVRQVVFDRLWIDDDEGGYFALGLDRDEHGTPRVLEVRTSNMGHLLDSRMLDGPEHRDRRTALVRTLFADDLLCAAGIRTLSAWEIRFWPASYHNGSSWPWDTYVIARGLHRHGYHGLAWELKRRIWGLCERQRCFPEFASGLDELERHANDRTIDVIDGRGAKNRLEQPPQDIQAWTVAAVLASKAEHGDLVLGRDRALPMHATGAERAVEEEILEDLRQRTEGLPASR